MVYNTLDALIAEIRSSDEYREFAAARERAMANSDTRALLHQYHQLQIQAQADAVTGKSDPEKLQRLQKLGELLQFDADASAYLLAEYRINTSLADIYKRLAGAVGISLDMLEN